VEPDVLIGGEKPGELWSDYANDVSQHWNEDEATIVGKDESCASRGPNGDLQGVEARKCRVGCLWKATVSCCLPAWQREEIVTHLRIPSIREEEEVGTVKEDVERWRAAGGSAGGREGQRTALCSPRRLGVRNSDLNHSERPIAIYETDYWRWAGVSQAVGSVGDMLA